MPTHRELILDGLTKLSAGKSRVFELRVPKAGRFKTKSGYFDSVEALADAAAELSGHYPGIYVTMNPVSPDLLARAFNRVEDYAEHTSKDQDITHRDWLLVDIDPTRPAGVSSTNAEKTKAREVASAVRSWLTEQGWAAPVAADSGNGFHLLYQIDLPNDAASATLLKDVLEVLGSQFDIPEATVDRKVFNASRIIKLYGTIAAKGDSTESRPHRCSHLSPNSQPGGIINLEQLQAVASLRSPAEVVKVSQSSGPWTLEKLKAFFQHCGWAYHKQDSYNGGVRFLGYCPENNHKDFAIFFNNGWVNCYCFHESDEACLNLRKIEQFAEYYAPWDRFPGVQRSLTMDFAECAIADANAKAANDTPQKSITEGLQRFELNDYGNLNRFASRYSPLLRYNKPTGGWLKWTGAYWKHSDTSLVTRYAIETIQNIEQERSLIVIPDDEAGKKAAAKEGASLFNWSHKSKSGPHTDWIVNHASSLPGVTLETSTLDAQINRFNVKNGTIDLTTGELLPHNPADYHTKISNFNYHPDTSSPLYDKFLLEVCDGDLEMVRFLLRAIGYSMLGSNPARVFFMLWGSSGTNGKSTLLNTLEHVFGDYAQSSHFSTFVKKPPTSGRSSDIARMRGARFVTAIETGKGESLNVPLLKTLTGGDNVTASFKFKEPFDFKPQLKLWLAMNDKPTVEETGAAIWNRVILIPFLVNFELSGRKDERLGEKLKAEADGILCRAVEGVMDYHQVGLSPPSTILNAKAEYRAEEDTLLRFLSEKCVLDPKGEIQSSHMANMYAEWCARNHEKVISGKAFTQEMRSHNHVAHKIHGVMTFEGLKTRDSAFTPSGDNIPDSEM